ncbi:MAG: hypothetical protein JWO43_191 [Candidatus Adlerbacteria bacterium]|nr:hypothetical protein [Candidatus Adlerbacteria bacterium]
MHCGHPTPQDDCIYCLIAENARLKALVTSPAYGPPVAALAETAADPPRAPRLFAAAANPEWFLKYPTRFDGYTDRNKAPFIPHPAPRQPGE